MMVLGEPPNSDARITHLRLFVPDPFLPHLNVAACVFKTKTNSLAELSTFCPHLRTSLGRIRPTPSPITTLPSM